MAEKYPAQLLSVTVAGGGHGPRQLHPLERVEGNTGGIQRHHEQADERIVGSGSDLLGRIEGAADGELHVALSTAHLITHRHCND